MSRAFTALRALLYSAGFIALWTWLAFWARDAGRRWPSVLPEWLSPLGMVLMIPGAVVVLACIASFVLVGRGTPAPFDPPRELTPSGPYRFVRNPMYIGALLVLIGFGLFERSLAVLMLTAGAWTVAHLLVVLKEEPDLEQRFGESYRRYKAAVPRWVPRA